MPRVKPREKFKTFENVFDEFTLANIFKLGKYFDEESLSPLNIGKEANVFSAKAKVGDRDMVAIKIHRLEASDFNNMYYYIKPDPRFVALKKRKREIIFAWAQREYRNLMAAREAGVRSPLPIAFLKNIIVMEFIGDEKPARQLKDAIPEDTGEFFRKIIAYMTRFYRAGFVHGDLSKFNILNHRETPVFIDFSQATPLRNPNSSELLRRDVVNVCSFFSRLGVKCDVEGLVKDIGKKKFK
ncbi:serine protein kinase RIO [Candidatus Woesearchaeota archaeon]|nr:serine protein kinase RIO [Candidatus Woesearchaeota archaeon]